MSSPQDNLEVTKLPLSFWIRIQNVSSFCAFRIVFFSGLLSMEMLQSCFLEPVGVDCGVNLRHGCSIQLVYPVWQGNMCLEVTTPRKTHFICWK